MDFDDLKALLWVHQHGSLLGASRATGVPRTTLRRRLEHLEASIGSPTHVAGPEGITLTAAGHALVDDGLELLAARQRLIERARDAVSPQHTLRVLFQVGLPPRAVASALAMGASMLPGVQLDLDFVADPASRAREPFDAIVHWGEKPVVRTGFTRTLFRASFGVMASAGYLAEHGAPETPADLDQHQILHIGGTEARWPCISGEFVDITPTHVCADLYVLGLMAGQGLGLALVPVGGPLVAEEIEALVPVLEDHIQVERRLRVDMPVPSQPDSAAAALIKVAEAFGQELTDIPAAS